MFANSIRVGVPTILSGGRKSFMAGEMTHGSTVPKPVYWPGALACLLFAVLAVWARGVRWDETWEHAQILSGQVVYPAGHPLAIYVHNAFSLQTYLSGGLVSLGAGPMVLCGLRNVLFLLASMLPVYVLTSWMTRSAVAGWLSALLMMQGILLEFDGSYPTMVWPEIYSNGHIGGGVVVLALAALIAGHFRNAFFLAGLVPCVHLGQWPPLAATAGLYGLYVLIETRRSTGLIGARLAGWTAWLGLGFVATFLFWFIQHHYLLPLPESGPFAAGGDVTAVWRGYTALHDPHRQFPPGNGHVMLAGTIVLATLGACRTESARLHRACVGLGIFASATGALVWGTMAVHAWFGPEIPFVLIAWMPYRLINLMSPILLALMVALLLTRWPVRGWWLLVAAALFGLLQPLWPSIVGQSLHGRYLAGGECVVFLLFGASLFAVVPRHGTGRWRGIVHATAPILPLAMYHRFGAVCVVAGIAGAWGLHRLHWPSWSGRVKGVVVAVLIAGAVALVVHQFHYRRTLPISGFQSEVAARLNGTAQTVLLGPPDSLLLQAATGFPVLAEVATPSLISYVPEIGPSIDQMYMELYGEGFRVPASGVREQVSWQTLWRARDGKAWRSLALRYGFSHVIAPLDLSLQLRQIVAAEGYALYAVDP